MHTGERLKGGKGRGIIYIYFNLKTLRSQKSKKYIAV